MAIDLKYDKVEWIEIGYDTDNKVSISNVVSFADRVVSPDDTMVTPVELVWYEYIPEFHHNHKYWEMEMTLDTDYIANVDGGALQNYWAIGQDVTVGAGGTAIAFPNGNYPIEWFKVYVREHDGTQTKITYADEETNMVWCVSTFDEISNEDDVAHQTKTFRFICFRERVKTYTSDTYTPRQDEYEIKFNKILYATIGNNTFNILKFTDECLFHLTPQFVPNRYQGIGVGQDPAWRLITFYMDSESDVFDAYIDITTANTVMPVISVYFEQANPIAPAITSTERWRYEGDNYMYEREHGTIHIDEPRDVFIYRIIVRASRLIYVYSPD